MRNTFLSIYLCITAVLLIFALSLIRLEYLMEITPDPLVGANCTRIHVQNDYDADPLVLADLECFFDFAQDSEFTLIYPSSYGRILISNNDNIGLELVAYYGASESDIIAYISTKMSNSMQSTSLPMRINATEIAFPVVASFEKDDSMLADYYLRYYPKDRRSDLIIPIEGEIWLKARNSHYLATQFQTQFASNSKTILIESSLDATQKFYILLDSLNMHLYMFLVYVLGAVLLCMNSTSVILFGIKRKHREIVVRRMCGATNQSLYWFFLTNYWKTLITSYATAIIVASLMQHLNMLNFLQLRVDPYSVAIAFPFHLLLGSGIGILAIHKALKKQIAHVLR